MGTFLSKWWPTIVALLTTISPLVLPAVQHLVAAHPSLATILLGLYSVLTHILPSPVATPSATIITK